MTAGRGIFLGLDLGTSGLKAVALDERGTVLGRADACYPTGHPRPGASEQDPQHWVNAAAEATRSLLIQLDGRVGGHFEIRTLGLSAMLPTLVLADSRLRPVMPAITWQDSRAEDHAEQLRAALGGDELYGLTGQWLDGRYLLPMFLGACARGEVPGGVQHLLGAKDWLLAWLTGTVVTDPSTAAGLGAYRLADGLWHQPVLDAAAEAAGPLPALPEVAPSASTLPLREQAARAFGLPPGLPVCVGGADSVLGALGVGAVAPGDVAYVAGTSTVIVGIAGSWRPDPQHRYLGTPLAGTPGVGLEMDLLATGSSLRWLTRLVNLRDEAELVQLAVAVPIEEAPTFLPYLAPGEQGALWDPRLRGAISGLSLHHQPGHLARGLLNGIVTESMRCLGTLADMGISGPVRVAGGSGQHPGFAADLADACGRPVTVPAEAGADYSAAGAARLAAAAIGEPLPAGAIPDQQYVPRPERAALWTQLAERHDRVRMALSEAEIERVST